MPKFSAKFISLFLVIIVFISCVKAVDAAISSCSATVSPSSVTPGSTNDFSFSIHNDDSSLTAQWVKISRPSSNFTINSHNISPPPGGSVSFDSSQITYSFLGPNSTFSFTASVTAGSSEASAADWGIQLSDDGGGVNPTSCGGSHSTAISSSQSDTSAPSISNIVVTDVNTTSVKVTWTTDENSSSSVDYGISDSYGSSGSGDGSTTSHSVSLSSLSAGTTYHYKVKSADSSGNSAESADNTFSTAVSGSTSSQPAQNTTTKTVTVTVTPTPTPTPAPDKIPPLISLDTSFEKPFPNSPKIEGRVTDSDAGGVVGGVSKLDYSIDDGKNWLPVDQLTYPGAKFSRFIFTPSIFEDGNYKLRMRALDLSGNFGYLRETTLIIDRLPPQVGGVLFTAGPQIISSKNGIFFALAGLKEKITLSSVGGPTEIEILANLSHLGNLSKNLENGLWSGFLTFDKAGLYKLTASAVDGAENKTERSLGNVAVLENGTVSDGKNPIKDALVSLYFFEQSSQKFILWDGKTFEQDNPQKTDGLGHYRLVVPPGKYYLQISAPGYKMINSQIFSLDQTLPINSNFKLEKKFGFSLGPFFISLPDFTLKQLQVKLNYPILPQAEDNLKGKELPYFSLKMDDKELNANTFKGKQTILTFLSSWSPLTFEQLNILGQIDQKEINVGVIMSQDTISRISIFSKIGGYKLPLIADPDGILVEPLGILNLPTHIFLDRKGIIKKVKSGVLTKDELLENLVN